MPSNTTTTGGPHAFSEDTSMLAGLMPIQKPPHWGHLRLDHPGTIYFTIFSLWTFLLLLFYTILFLNRHLPFIRLKNVPLVSWTLVFLHIQLSFDILLYPLNGVLPCELEYWITSLCLP